MPENSASPPRELYSQAANMRDIDGGAGRGAADDWVITCGGYGCGAVGGVDGGFDGEVLMRSAAATRNCP